MTTTPTLNGQVLGQAERATRAVLDKMLAGTGIPFTQWVTVNVTATGDQPVARADLVQRVASGLKIEEAAADSALDSVLAAGLLESSQDGSSLTLTAAGRQRHTEIVAGIAALTNRLYADLPAEDLATAGRVLTIVTARANAELGA